MKKIKRMFLVSAEIQRWLKKYVSSAQKIEQFYTLSNADERCCYQKLFPDTYTKIMVDAEGNETVTPVTEVIYLSQREHHLGRIITKQSYRVVFDTCSFVIDKYLKNLEGIYKVTAYFQDEKVLHDSEVLEALQPFVLKEIDQDKKYSDHALAGMQQVACTCPPKPPLLFS